MDRRTLLKNTAVVLGCVTSSSITLAVMSGVNGSAKVAKPFFTDQQRKQCMQLCELIIPQTDTAGAIEAGVPQFVEVMVSDWYTDKERGIFSAGLKELDDYCVSNFKKTITDCTIEQQTIALEKFESDSKSYKTDVPSGPLSAQEDENKPFFQKIKELTVLGYYTSELGAKQELSYNPMPMRYDGDYDLSETGRQWSTTHL